MRRSPPPGPRGSSRCSPSPAPPGFAEGPGRPSSATSRELAARRRRLRPVRARRRDPVLRELRRGSRGCATTRPGTSPTSTVYLTPQYRGQAPGRAAAIYRRLLNSFYAGVKAVDPANVGDHRRHRSLRRPEPGGDRTRPLTFLRELLCLRGHRTSARPSCPSEGQVRRPRPPPDQHHRPPDRSRRSAPTTRRSPTSIACVTCVRAAEAAGTAPGGPHPLWATEVWWSSDPPDPRGLRPRKQALLPRAGALPALAPRAPRS